MLISEVLIYSNILDAFNFHLNKLMVNVLGIYVQMLEVFWEIILIWKYNELLCHIDRYNIKMCLRIFIKYLSDVLIWYFYVNKLQICYAKVGMASYQILLFWNDNFNTAFYIFYFLYLFIL